PVKQGRAVFAEAEPAPSSAASRALHSPGHTISISRVKGAKRSAAGRSILP
ncbi:hypothetical protein JG687_00018773, partial [Phytophthora cactorum]